MTELSRRTLVGAGAAIGLSAALPATATAAPQRIAHRPHALRWARDTWRCLLAMTHRGTGLIADTIDGDLRTPSANTSPTNIGGYLWSVLVAQRLGFISTREATWRANQTLETLLGMDRHEPSGMYFNWYDPADGRVLRRWPDSGDLVVPFVSSVDMGWLGAATWAVRNALPGARRRADRLWDDFRWDVFFDPDFDRAPGPTTAASTPRIPAPSRTRARFCSGAHSAAWAATTSTTPRPITTTRASPRLAWSPIWAS